MVGAFQVGDGAVGLYHDDGTCVILGEADHGAYASETRFLTTPRIDEGLESRAVVAVPTWAPSRRHDDRRRRRRLLPGEDAAGGIVRRATPFAGLTDAQGGPLPGVLRGPARDPREGRALVEWLRYEKRGSSDDRTLVLLFRVEGGAA